MTIIICWRSKKC